MHWFLTDLILAIGGGCLILAMRAYRSAVTVETSCTRRSLHAVSATLLIEGLCLLGLGFWIVAVFAQMRA